MPVFNIQLTLPATPTLLVHVGAPSKAYFSWQGPSSTFGNPPWRVLFGDGTLNASNGFRVSMNAPYEPFVIDVPANEFLYAMADPNNPSTGPVGLTMMVVY
jgi:hypothetical protein